MRLVLIFFIILFNNLVYAKEWNSLKIYQKTTQKQHLSPSDWLKSDRLNNTLVWQQANHYNLVNNLPEEYCKIKERRDFYKWLYQTLDKKGHEVVWVKMAHYISLKLGEIEIFPCTILSNKAIIKHANTGSKLVFDNALSELKLIYKSDKIYNKELAINWDKDILYKEQYFWIDSIYKRINAKNLKKLQRIAQGHFLYSLVVPKKIRFKRDLVNSKERYNYAFSTLRAYCKNRYK